MKDFQVVLHLVNDLKVAYRALVRIGNPPIVVYTDNHCETCTMIEMYLKKSEIDYKRITRREHHHSLAVVWKGSEYPLKFHPSDKESISKYRLKRIFKTPTKIRLLNHQKDLVSTFSDENNWNRLKTYLLYWSMGSGKTIGVLSLFSTPAFIDKSVHSEIVIICPNSMIDYWVDSIAKLEQAQNSSTTFHIFGYTQFAKTIKSEANFCRNKVVVVDEAHHYRNLTKPMQEEIAAIRKAKNIFLLTGTPAVNDVDDLYGLMALYGASFSKLTEQEFSKMIKGKVSYYDPKVHDAATFSENFPSMTEITIKVPMTWKQSFEYFMSTEQKLKIGGLIIQTSRSNSYDTLLRLISNSACIFSSDAPKLKKIAEQVNQHEFPQMIYSHFIERGIDYLQKELLQKNPTLKIQVLTGQTLTKDRNNIVKNYNTGRIDVLLVTDAAKEGIDLHNTKAVHIAEPHENIQSENQTINRVARYLSHEHSECKEIYVYKYLSIFPEKTPDGKEKKEIQKIFEDHYLKSEPLDIDVVQELFKKFKLLKTTVDEKKETHNLKKHREIQSYLNILRK